jgi:hypothetical protein
VARNLGVSIPTLYRWVPATNRPWYYSWRSLNIVGDVPDDLLRSEARIGVFWEALWLANGGCAIPRRACRAANDRALRPAAEAGDAEHRGADFDLRVTHAITQHSL